MRAMTSPPSPTKLTAGSLELPSHMPRPMGSATMARVRWGAMSLSIVPSSRTTASASELVSPTQS